MRGRLDIPRAPRTEKLLASYSQQQVWLAAQLRPDASAYNVAAVFELDGELDVAALKSALLEIARRHESLRTKFRFDGRDLEQVIGPEDDVHFGSHDLSGLGSAEKAAELDRLKAGETQYPFELDRDRLCRLTVVRLADARHLLILCIHHLICDGWSIGVLFRELKRAYGQCLRAAAEPPAELPIQYADYAAWQRAQFSGGVDWEKSLAYWRAKLQGAGSEVAWPGVIRREGRSPCRKRCVAVLEQALVADVQLLGRRHKATLFMVLLTAFGVALYRLTGQRDLLFGSPVANRHPSVVQALIGYFVNTVVLRLTIDDRQTFADLLAQVRATTLEMLEHQHLQFDKLVEHLRPPTARGSPLYRVMFGLQNAAQSKLEFAGVTVREQEVIDPNIDADLALHVREDAGSLRAAFYYDADLLEEACVRTLVADYRAVLERAVSDPAGHLLGPPRPNEARTTNGS